MGINVNAAILWSWIVLVIVWLAGVAFTKPTVRAQPGRSRIGYITLAVAGGVLLGLGRPGAGWLGRSFMPHTEAVALTGLALTVAGCLFAIWARATLGSNWSARAAVKADHELVTRGPYALARHPIYTGILLAVAGTALARGRWVGLIGLVLILAAIRIKIGQEERMMLDQFPAAYPAYRRRVRALIPGIF